MIATDRTVVAEISAAELARAMTRSEPDVSGMPSAYCLGCCWVLMALLFVGGIMNLYWIVGLAAFAALEKLTSHGVILSRLMGVTLVVLGVVILVGLA